MKQLNMPKEDRVKFLDELETSKILTQSVKERINQIKNE